MEWLKDQMYHFNVISFAAIILIVAISQLIEKSSTTREIKEIAQEIYKNCEELKDTIRDYLN